MSKLNSNFPERQKFITVSKIVNFHPIDGAETPKPHSPELVDLINEMRPYVLTEIKGSHQLWDRDSLKWIEIGNELTFIYETTDENDPELR